MGGQADVHLVLVVPDLFASELLAPVEDGKLPAVVWPPAQEDDLDALDADDLAVGGLVASWLLAPLNDELTNAAAVEAVPYDWRGGIGAAAAALETKVDDIAGDGRKVSLVGHGLGALGVLRWMAQSGDSRAEALAGGRAVLLAPPLHGAEEACNLALGRSRTFRILDAMASRRHASAVLAPFLHLRGLADLLPDRALVLDWWDDAAQDAPSTDAVWPDVLEQRRALRAVLRDPGETPPWVVFGAAEGTVRYELDDSGELTAELATGGDGWMINPVDAVPDGRAHHLPALHEQLLNDQTVASAVAALLLDGDPTGLPTEPPARPPRRGTGVAVQPGRRDLLETLTGYAAAPIRLRVQVAHGSLDRLSLPVAVGHYASDELLGAESFLDKCLGGRLRRRQRLGNYPGPAGTACFVDAECDPPGALVVGLGEIGELTAPVLSEGVSKALLDYALHVLDQRLDCAGSPGAAAGGPVELEAASLLIGTRGGKQLSIQQSVSAVTRGALLAQRALVEHGLQDQVSLRRLVFVELWSDIAIAAGHAMEHLADDPGLGLLPHETIDAEPRLIPLDGRRGNSRIYRNDWSWWRRLIVSGPQDRQDRQAGAGHEDGGDGRRADLRFVSLGERSRAEERLLASHRVLVDELIRRSTRSIDDVGPGSVATTLFELLLPNALKETIFDGDDLVLVLDEHTARYPWELLARRGDDGIEPVISRLSLVRQLRSPSFRERIVPALTHHALVVGAPSVSGLVDLRGAQEESQEVAELLDDDGFEVTRSIGESSQGVVQKLFKADYRILHVAAHGQFRADDPGHSGVVIGRRDDGELVFLTADVLRQLRSVPEVAFLNCCHLGGITRQDDQEPDNAERGALAASLARTLIELGVRCVVVAGWAVDDQAARTFAGRLYRLLLDGREYGAALRGARHAVWERHGHTTTWGAYQCYGDPTFRLSRPSAGHGDDGGPGRFVARTEACESISDITAAAACVGVSRAEKERRQNELRQIEEQLAEHEEEWMGDGELLHELAAAWQATGDPLRAIDYYGEALASWDGKAPIKAAEQLANLLDRYGERYTRDGAEPPHLLPPATDEVEERSLTEGWLAWADRLGNTPERHALRGAALKRQALASSSSTRYALLRRARDAYLAAVRLQSEPPGRAPDEPPGEVPYYQGLNAVALAWATGGAWESDALPSLDRFLESCRASARGEQERNGKKLWNALALPEADLLEALMDGSLDAARARDLAASFYETLGLGDPSQIDSARGQIDFLRECAAGRRERFSRPLRIIADAFERRKE